MEGWLQGSDCGSPWGPLDILQGEAPRGDVYQGHHLFQGTGMAHCEVRGLVEPGLVGYFGTSQESHDTPQASPPMSLVICNDINMGLVAGTS